MLYFVLSLWLLAAAFWRPRRRRRRALIVLLSLAYRRSGLGTPRQCSYRCCWFPRMIWGSGDCRRVGRLFRRLLCSAFATLPLARH